MTPDATTIVASPRSPAPLSETPIAFTGRRGPLLLLLLKNLVLTLLTLGIYRFWAKVAVRRFFWSQTSVLDDPLEYTGTGKELLIGFLIALLFLVPLGLAYGAIDMLVAPGPSGKRAALEGTYYLVLLFLIQVAVFRVWRYRLSRTLWRGIRFGQDGSSLGYAWLSMGWLLLTVLSLGIAYPWRSMALWQYRLSHTRFGTTPLQFEARAARLLPIWLAMLAPVWAAVIAMIYAASTHDAPNPAGGIAAGGGILAAVVLTPPLYTVYRVREARLVVGGIRLGEAGFASRLRTLPILGAVFAMLGLALVALGIVVVPSALAGFEAARQAAASGGPPQIPDVSVLAILLSVVAFTVLLPMLGTLILQTAVVRGVAATTSVDHAEALETVAQATDRGPSYGEGLADAFDVGAF